MRLRLTLIIASLFPFLVFTIFSYTVAKERWTAHDFDTTVKLQDKISSRLNEPFSYLSIIGSAEVTLVVAIALGLWELLRKRLLAFIGWLMILPASVIEVVGKLMIFHPGPPFMFHRNVLEAKLPSFYIHTNFSYPSGHMTRTVFILTGLIMIIIFSKIALIKKLLLIGGLTFFGAMMALTRVYLGEHWLSDVIGGTLLGISAGIFAGAFIIRNRVLRQP